MRRAGYRLAYTAACRYDAPEVTGLCASGGTALGGGDDVLPGTPLMAYAVGGGRATGVLVGVVTRVGGGGGYDVLARVAVTLITLRP
jgi:hypothetical protein